MLVLIGCDVDPVLPAVLDRRPERDIWEPLNRVPRLVDGLGGELPPITWLIRADESVRFATGEYASGYLSRKDMWSQLAEEGHEFGWHMHLLNWSPEHRVFLFDSHPTWLAAAHNALEKHFAVRATRTGWDYGSTFLFRELDRLGIAVDFSALPGNRAWYRFGPSVVMADWLGCGGEPYRPSKHDYRRPGQPALDLLEIPIAQFQNSWVGRIKRLVWRMRHGCLSMTGLACKTRLMTEPWDELPFSQGEIWAFHFHPEDLTDEGILNFQANVRRLRAMPKTEFITATAARRWHHDRTSI